METNNFRSDLTDISAETKSMVGMANEHKYLNATSRVWRGKDEMIVKDFVLPAMWGIANANGRPEQASVTFISRV